MSCEKEKHVKYVTENKALGKVIENSQRLAGNYDFRFCMDSMKQIIAIHLRFMSAILYP